MSNRELLATALEETVQSDGEARMLAQYKEQIQKVSQEQQKLGQLKKEATMKTIYIDADYLCHASAFSLP